MIDSIAQSVDAGESVEFLLDQAVDALLEQLNIDPVRSNHLFISYRMPCLL